MFVKIMSGESKQDKDPSKCFSIYGDIDDFAIVRDEENVVSIIMVRDGREITVQPVGNIYCYSEMGSKIALFSLDIEVLYYNQEDFYSDSDDLIENE